MEYRGFTLDPFQSDAITHLGEGRSVLVCAPTGTGKTIIADWVVDQALSTGRQVVYTAPIKALSNQKFRDYTRLHNEEDVGLVTGDLVIRRDAPCRVMTTEILRNMLLGSEDLSQLFAVIIDEIHFLDDPERGTVWEEILIYLPPHVLIVGLSATLSNQQQFAEWLGSVRGAPIEVITETRRSVPLEFHLANIDVGLVDRPRFEKRWKRHRSDSQASIDRGGRRGRGRGRDRGGPPGRKRDTRKRRFVRKTRHSNIIRMMVEAEYLPCLYFCFSRRDIEAQARWLARNMPVDVLNHQEAQALDTYLARAREQMPKVLNRDLLDMYGRGIAFHHAGLHVSLKALVEELYEQKLIKILYCTSTFALGLNMPARGVAFDGLRKYDGKGVNPLSIRGFMQKAGRAGRRGLDEVGHVVLRIDFEEYEEVRPLLDGYFEGRPEPVRSSFSLSWNSIVSLLSRNERDQVREIVEKSFLSWHMDQEADKHTRDAQKLEAQAEAQSDHHKARRSFKQAKKLHKRAASAGSRCWGEFLRKERFLIKHGYLSNEGEFYA
ncbi:MAG: DEAD/DEAH box helicase, partial [Myxococcota bacterium]